MHIQSTAQYLLKSTIKAHKYGKALAQMSENINSIVSGNTSYWHKLLFALAGLPSEIHFMAATCDNKLCGSKVSFKNWRVFC